MPNRLEQASALVRSERPDVIILTSALRFGSSCSPLLDAEDLARICGASLVLTTAYPERFLRGEPGEWAFILGKPFSPAAIAAMVSQSLRTRAAISA